MRGRRRSSRLLRVVTALLRVLAVVVSFELSGASAVAAELVASGNAVDGCCTDCPLEEGGKSCPLGCPICHCSHGGAGLPPAFESEPVKAVTTNKHVEPPPYEASVPRPPLRPGVYRPPRSLRPLS